MLSYLVDWGNGYVGGYTENLDQQFNTPKQNLFETLKLYEVENFKFITPLELDELRGFYKPKSQEFFRDMQKEQYEFIMSLGDWSGDGHGRHEDYHIHSNKPVEDVREAHFAIKEQTGIDIEALDAPLMDGKSIPFEVVEKVEATGFPLDRSAVLSDGWWPDHYNLLELWLFLLQKVDPTLILNLCAKPEIPTLHFYGFDAKGRHIGQVGYAAML